MTATLLLTGCSSSDQGSDVDPDQVDAVQAPEIGACRMLTPEDVAKPSNATRSIPCTEPHTAETYAVGTLPDEYADVDYTDEDLGRFAYRTCSDAFKKFLGTEESTVMRSVVSWAWFRPSEKAWEDGARWYRCDIVGGGEQSKEYVELPETAEALLRGQDPDDKWMVCAEGPTVAGSVKVPCSEPHDWRAVSTVKPGDDDEPYPGDRMVQVRTRDFCSESVLAYVNYAADYDFGFTWFGKGEWEAGNRRSICWARTSK